VEGTLPQVHRLLVPETIVRELFPEEVEVDSPVATADGAT
jgi:hypothetical protein